MGFFELDRFRAKQFFIEKNLGTHNEGRFEHKKTRIAKIAQINIESIEPR